MSVISDAYVYEEVTFEVNMTELKNAVFKSISDLNSCFDDFCALDACKGITTRRGASEQYRELLDRNQRMSQLAEMDITQVPESKLIGALESLTLRAIRAIISFFKRLWDRISEFFKELKKKRERQKNPLEIIVVTGFEGDEEKMKTEKFDILNVNDLEKVGKTILSVANHIKAIHDTHADKMGFSYSDLGTTEDDLKAALGLVIENPGNPDTVKIQQATADIITSEEQTLLDANIHDINDVEKYHFFDRLRYASTDILASHKVLDKICNQKVQELFQKFTKDPDNMPDEDMVTLNRYRVFAANLSTVVMVTETRITWLFRELAKIAGALHSTQKPKVKSE